MPRPQILSIPARLDADPAATGRGVVVAFADLGFFAHPDLLRPERRVRAFVDVTRERPRPDDFHAPHPTSWHGTMTACAACGNGYLSAGHFRGVASDAELVLLKASNDRRVHGKNVAAAIRFPVRHPELGVRVMSISLGVSADDPDVADVDRAVEEAVAHGIAVFVAAGNDPSRPVEAPGTAMHAITVGGADDHNRVLPEDVSGWSSSSFHDEARGIHKPDLVAPAIWLPAPMLPGTLVAREGAAILQLLSVLEEESAEQSHVMSLGDSIGDAERGSLAEIMNAVDARMSARKYVSADYQHVDGTSFAAPIAASVAAQMLEVAPHLTPAQVREGLVQTAVPIEGVARELQGAGVLRPREAVAWARAHMQVR